MNNTAAFVLAAGEAIRMHRKKKQLLPIGKTNILERILAQLKYYGIHTVLVTHDKEIAEYHDRVHCPENHDTTCDSLLSTSHLWQNKTIVLLGDVIYSHKAMDDIVNCHDAVRVFGNRAEIFAVVFHKGKHDLVKSALDAAREHKSGKLRYFYHAYCGFEIGLRERGKMPMERKIFFHVKDWTRDVDTPQNYDALIKELVITGKIDDKS